MPELILPLPPSTNSVYRHRAVGKRSMMYMTKEGKAYKAAVVAAASLCRPEIGPVRVHMDVYLPRRAGDLANREKLVLDALQGYAYVDDKQIVELEMRKWLDHDNPRLVIAWFHVPGYEEGCPCGRGACR